MALIVEESNAPMAVAVARGQREASQRSCDLHVVVVRKGDDVAALLKERFSDKPPDYVLVDAPGCQRCAARRCACGARGVRSATCLQR